MPEWSEILIILVVAMVVFGPHRLPTMARKAGRMVAEFRVAARELREGIEKELAVEEMREAASEVLATTKDATKDLRTSLSDSEKALRSSPPLARPTDTKPGTERSGQEATRQEVDTAPDGVEPPGETELGHSSSVEAEMESTPAPPDDSPPEDPEPASPPEQQS